MSRMRCLLKYFAQLRTGVENLDSSFSEWVASHISACARHACICKASQAFGPSNTVLACDWQWNEGLTSLAETGRSSIAHFGAGTGKHQP
jgi:hypothetical protein